MDNVAARRNMVESQLRTNRIEDPAVRRAFAEVPRELFVPRGLRGHAYVDHHLAVGGGRWLLQPLTVARLVAGAAIRPSDVVLCVGDATGYGTAVAARLASFVVSLDCDAEWVQRAGASLGELGTDNVEVVHGPLHRGHPAKAPYDAIVVFGAVGGDIPGSLCRQLAEGGRLIAMVETDGVSRGVLVVRSGEAFGRRVLFEGSAPLLPGFQPHVRFQF